MNCRHLHLYRIKSIEPFQKPKVYFPFKVTWNKILTKLIQKKQNSTTGGSIQFIVYLNKLNVLYPFNCYFPSPSWSFCGAACMGWLKSQSPCPTLPLVKRDSCVWSMSHRRPQGSTRATGVLLRTGNTLVTVCGVVLLCARRRIVKSRVMTTPLKTRFALVFFIQIFF